MGEVLKINGVWVHDPSELEYGLQDLDGESGAGRNQQHQSPERRGPRHGFPEEGRRNPVPLGLPDLGHAERQL